MHVMDINRQQQTDTVEVEAFAEILCNKTMKKLSLTLSALKKVKQRGSFKNLCVSLSGGTNSTIEA